MSGVFGRIRTGHPEAQGPSLRQQLAHFGHFYEGSQIVPIEAEEAELFIIHNGAEHWRHASESGVLDVYGAIDSSSLTAGEWDGLIRSPVEGLPLLDGSYLAVIRRPQGEVEVWTDASGSIPLYWAVDDGTLSFGTENAFLLDGSEPASRLDSLAFVSRLLFRVASFERSVWNGIRLLPIRAGLVVAADGSHRIERWTPSDWSATWRSKEEYAQLFLEAFHASVQRQLNRCSGRPTGIYLSAGLDSRFIASCLRAMDLRFPALTYETGTAEIPIARRVASKLGLDQVLLPLDFDFLPEGGWEFLRSSSAELNISYGFTIPLSRHVSADFKFMWEGALGDQLFPKDQLHWFGSMPKSMSTEQAVDYFLSHCPGGGPCEIEGLRADSRFAAGYEQFRSDLMGFFATHRKRNWLAAYLAFQREHGSIRRRSLLGVHNQRNYVSLCCPFLSQELDRLAMSYAEMHYDHLEMYARIVSLVNVEMLRIPLNHRSLPGVTKGLRYQLSRRYRAVLRRVSPYGRRRGFARRLVRDIRGSLGSVLEEALRDSRLADAGLLEGDTVRFHLKHLRDGRQDDEYYMAAQLFTLEHAIRLFENRIAADRR